MIATIDAEDDYVEAPLQDELLQKIDAYWRAANYLSVGQIYLLAIPCLKRRSPCSTSNRDCLATGEPRPG